MKHLAILPFLVGFFARGGAQPLQAHAGVDTVWCTAATQTGPRVGGNPAATGGIGPYTYSWTYPAGGLASFTVDSPTKARPQVVSQNSIADSLDLVLEVTDASNAVARDTVRIYRTRHVAVLVDCRFEKSAGGTVQLWLTGLSQFGPYSHRWLPSLGLSNDTAATPRSWTPVNTTYMLTSTDRLRCPSYHQCKVFVWPTAVNDLKSSGHSIRIIPSPVTPDSRIEISPDLLGSELRIFSSDGRTICAQTLRSLITPLTSMIALPPGHYFYRVVKTGSPPLTGRFCLFYAGQRSAVQVPL